MRTAWLALFALIVLTVSPSVSAQQTTSSPPATSDPQAVALVQRSLLALIGSTTVTDVTLSGSAQRIAGSDDETGTANVTAMAGGYSKLSLNFPSGLRSEIRNPSAIPLPGALPSGMPAATTQVAQPAGAWSGPDGTLHGMANHNIMTDSAWFFPALTLADIAGSSNYVVFYVGQETLNGQSVVHFAASRPFVVLSGTQLPPGPPGTSFAAFMQQLSHMDIYLDPTTSLPVALAFNAHPDGNALVNLPVQIQFFNYQPSNGVQVPLHVQKYLNNSLILDLQFTNVSLNSGLSAASFQLQ